MSEATQQGADLQSAASAIGGLFSGENKKPQPEAKQSQSDNRATESATDDGDDVVDIRKETKPSKEASNEDQGAEDDGQGTEDEGEYELPESLDRFAEDIGVDASKLFTLKVKTKIDGTEGEATLADLIKSYQLEGHLNKKSMAFSEQQKAYEAQVSQQKHAIEQELHVLNNYTQFVENEMYEEFKAIDWDTLYTYNPADYAAKRLQFQDRQNNIQNYRRAINHKQNEELQKQQTELQHKIAKTIENEQQKLLARIPEWSNSEKASAERQNLRSYLQKFGYDAEDLDSVLDHRYVVLARKAMLYDKLAQSKDDLTKKVKVLPKYMKQSGSKSKADGKQAVQQTKLRQLKKSGSVKDAASLLFDMF
jgi:hypothetical protein